METPDQPVSSARLDSLASLGWASPFNNAAGLFIRAMRAQGIDDATIGRVVHGAYAESADLP